MSFVFNEAEFKKESEEFYSTYPADVSEIENELNQRYEKEKVSAMVQKKWTYEAIAQKCKVKVFRYCPFYSEVITGRDRNSVAGAFPPIPGLGCWALRTHYPVKEFDDWRKPYVERDLLFAEMMTDHSHHYADVERVLYDGFEKIRKEVSKMKAESTEEQEFKDSMLAACDAAIALGYKFSEEADRMLQTEKDDSVREQLIRIRDTAGKVPRFPAKTFYEALTSVWFTRELCTAMEGSGFAVMGHYDRILYPYYRKDIEEQRITKEEAQNLIDCMMLITEARWKHNENTSGTNASVVIGGCDREGNIIYNEVTEMILNSFEKYEVSSPKLQIRISSKHPDKYKKHVALIAKLGRNCLSILNDDVLIGAHHRAGKKIEDCRMYLAGGCQEPVLSNECNSRAFMYLNLPLLLDAMLFPKELDFWSKENLRISRVDTAQNFEQFYESVVYNTAQFLAMCAVHYYRFEQIWSEINPMPLYSATMKSCIEKKTEITKGGAVYNSTSFSLIGIGTFIDSLYAIKKTVFEDRKYTLEHLKEMIKADFQGFEADRQYLMNKLPKYGQPDAGVDKLAKQVFHDLAKHSSGMPNPRGGYYEASLFAFFFYDFVKENTWATPDGRHAGQRISRGCNPGETSENIDAATLMNSLRSIDMAEYPGCGVTYLEMPVSQTDTDVALFEYILSAFVHCGGSALDFNVVDKDKLIKAKENPDQYRNLVVRVCGYSAPFISLSEELQDEIIQRALRNG